MISYHCPVQLVFEISLYTRQIFKIFLARHFIHKRFESRYAKIPRARKLYFRGKIAHEDGWSSRSGKEKHCVCIYVCVYCLSRHTIYSYLLIARKDIAVTIQSWQRFLSAFFPVFFSPFGSRRRCDLSPPISPLSPSPGSSTDIPSCVARDSLLCDFLSALLLGRISSAEIYEAGRTCVRQ